MAGAAAFDLGAGLGAATMAHIAVVPARDTDLGVFAACSFFKRDFHRIAEVVPAEHLLAAAIATALLAKHIAKDVAKGLGKSTVGLGTSGTHVRVDAGMAVLIVGCALLGVRQHLVGFLGLLEFLLGRLGGITLIAVRVVLHRLLAISLLDFFIRGVLRNAQDFVKVSFCHV